MCAWFVGELCVEDLYKNSLSLMTWCPQLKEILLEVSTLNVDGKEGLGMTVHNISRMSTKYIEIFGLITRI